MFVRSFTIAPVLGIIALVAPLAVSAAPIPVLTLTVPLQIGMGTPPGGTAPKLVLGCALVTGSSVLDVTIPATATTPQGAFESAPTSGGLPGKLLEEAYQPIALDVAGTFVGNLTVSLVAQNASDAKAASTYACELFTATPAFARIAKSDLTYASFATSVRGSL